MMIKKILLSLKKLLITVIIISFSIGIFFGIIYFFRYVGLKGLLGFVVGGLLVGYVMISEHPFIVVYREYFLK